MIYLTIKDLLLIHSFAIDETGGLHGVRDRGRLKSTVARPQQVIYGRELYPSIFEKAAVYTHSLLFDHPFVDGNKRTAMICAFVFLENNGYVSSVKKGAVKQFALRAVRTKMGIPSIAAWLKRRSVVEDRG